MYNRGSQREINSLTNSIGDKTMKGIIYDNKVIIISDNTTANEIINTLHYDGYVEDGGCTDISMNIDSLSYMDSVEWELVTLNIIDIDIINI